MTVGTWPVQETNTAVEGRCVRRGSMDGRWSVTLETSTAAIAATTTIDALHGRPWFTDAHLKSFSPGPVSVGFAGSVALLLFLRHVGRRSHNPAGSGALQPEAEAPSTTYDLDRGLPLASPSMGVGRTGACRSGGAEPGRRSSTEPPGPHPVPCDAVNRDPRWRPRPSFVARKARTSRHCRVMRACTAFAGVDLRWGSGACIVF